MIEKITESKTFISEIIEGKNIESVIVLGSGMSGFEENYNPLYQLNYSEIPNFLQPSIEGHSGKLSIVDIEGKITANDCNLNTTVCKFIATVCKKKVAFETLCLYARNHPMGYNYINPEI